MKSKIDVSISEEGGFYTVYIHTDEVVSFTKSHLKIDSIMAVSEKQFFLATEKEAEDYIKLLITNKYSVELNNRRTKIQNGNVIYA